MKYSITDDKDTVGPWVCQRIQKVWGPEGRTAIGLLRGDEIVAGVVYEDYTTVAIQMHFAIAHPHVPMRKLRAAAFHYPFDQLGVERIFGFINSTNTPALDYATRLGFKAEAIIEGVYADGDLVIMCLKRAAKIVLVEAA